MKENIHPKYASIEVTCNCGNVMNIGSTILKNFKVEICNKCHPFFTGKQKIVDSAGRVQKFAKKFAAISKSKKAAGK